MIRRHVVSAMRSVPVALRVVLFGVLLAGVGVFLLLVTPTPLTTPDRAWQLPFFGLVLAFGIAEGTALHVEIRKESHSLSLSAIPLMFGVLYMSPVEVVLAYVLGGGATLVWIRKSPVLKAAWNCSLFVAQTALAALIVRSVLGEDLPEHALEWLVPFAAVMASELLSLVAVPLVIMAVDAKFRPGLFATVGQSQILAALGGAFTVTMISASSTDPNVMFFALVPVIGIGVLLRSTGLLSQRYEDLQQMFGFTNVLANERGARTLDTGLVHLVEIMRARTAGLLTDDRRMDVRTLRLLVDDRFVEGDPDRIASLLLDVLDDGTITELDQDDPRPAVRELLAELGVGRLLAARVLGKIDRNGVLFIADRLGMRDSFTTDEVRLFTSLADTLSTRLSNDHLVEELETQAQHDALTGLPNRLNFEVALTSSLADSRRTGAVVLIDLDRFKEINDSLGHDTGDELLVEVARRLRGLMRSTDMAARFGGDEFALLITNRSGGESELASRLAEIHAALTRSYQLRGISFEIGASLGAVSWPSQSRDGAELLRRADTAMYHAKRNQLGVAWYTHELDADAPRRLDLYLSARSALETEELFIVVQPKVATRTGEVTGAEALVRWTHPVHGVVSPDEFVPLIEHAGLVGQLTRFVVRRAAHTLSTFRSAGIELPIAVNLTPRDLLDASLPSDVAAILEEYELEPSALEFEVTEDAMIVDFDTSVTVLSRLRELGSRIAIDDFGTGYSSLQHLHRLPVDQLKIDRSFIRRAATDESAAAIVRASIGLGRELGLRTIAEGVEDRYGLDLVTRFGCDEVQGYHFSRPLPASDFMRWYTERSSAMAARSITDAQHV